MEQENSYRELEKKAKNKTKIFLIISLFFWMIGLFFFLNQSRHEQSLIFAKVLPTGWEPTPKDFIILINDTSLIDHNIDPIRYIVDTTDIQYDSSKVKNAYSLRQYAPLVLSQGQLGSCVAWASTYAGLTIVKRIENNNIKFEPFSPLNLYVRYKKIFHESPCSYGACLPVALNLLKQKGCNSFQKFPNSCDGNVSEKIEYTDKLYDFDAINSNEIIKIKSAITAKMPVVIGIKCYSSNDWQRAVLDDGVWSGYYSGTVNGGHAMCLIGFDDNKAGGAFEIMNSWGDDWGDKGFFWIKYTDFAIHVEECYAMITRKN
jgi:C1A family cysteine protease